MLMTGCSGNTDKETSYISPERKATMQSEQIIKYFIDHDMDSLKNMFSDRVKKVHDLDREISKAFDYIGGEIISYDDPHGTESYKESREGQGYTKRYLGGDIKDIETSTGKIYLISFSSIDIFQQDESMVGISSISVYNENFESVDIGESW